MTFGFAADGRTNGATLKRLHQVTLAAEYATFAATAAKRFWSGGCCPLPGSSGHHNCTVVELSDELGFVNFFFFLQDDKMICIHISWN